MRRLVRLLFLISVMVGASTLLAPSVMAQTMEQDGGGYALNQDVSDPCPTYDACTMYTYSPTFGWVASACKMQPGTPCKVCDGRNRCSTAQVSASCECRDVPKPGAGPNITECGMHGSCIYRSN